MSRLEDPATMRQAPHMAHHPLRSRCWSPWALLGVLAVILAACSSTAKPDNAAPTSTAAVSSATSPTTAPTGSFAPDEPGPYGVGRSTFTVTDDARDRELPVEVWYPATTADGDPVSTYEFVPGVSIDGTLAVDGAPPVEGPFPLVVFSHGDEALRTQSVFHTEVLASHGFVVVAPDHVGRTARDRIAGTSVDRTQSAIDRPQDVSAVIDAMMARAGEGDPVARTVDFDRIGVTGHSFGGLTSLVLAGGGELGDDRVRAIAPVAPASFVFSDEALTEISIPTMLVGGTADRTMPIDPEVSRPFELISSPVAYRVDVTDAGHLSFSDVCEILAAFAASAIDPSALEFLTDLADEGCGDDLAPIETVQALTNRYVVAFFAVYLAGDETYADYLSETDGVTFYQRQE